MRKLLVLLVAPTFLAGNVRADPASVTTNVNLRSGPGTGFSAIGKIPEGSQVDLKECDASGAWCATTFGKENGFVSGQYLSRTAAETASWPRTFTADSDATLTLFQPQVVDWSGFTKLDALIATELKTSKDASPVYGVIGVTAKTVADDETDNVLLTDVEATEVNFSTLNKDQLAKLALGVGKILPTDPITVSQDRLTASLADYKRLNDVSGLRADPPPVFHSETPAILVQTDGKAVVSPVKGVQGLSFVVNTNWDVFQSDADKAFYLRDEKSWLTAKALDGEWTEAAELPPQISSLPDENDWKDVKPALPTQKFLDGNAPKVFYSDVPAELLVFEGKPALEKVPGTGLEWASNTTSDVFYRPADKTWYVLLSGRWFSAQSLDGPWTFATPNLPGDFQSIPQDASYYSVRASIPGTSESAEARLKASIPQMARVATDGTVKVDVSYSGDPRFEAIEGSSLSYAVNSNEQVIKVGAKYFVLKDGVWFVGGSPTGPFEVAKAVPDEIYKIPASSPVYNVTYVRVYDTEPAAVWYGYTAGYLGAYLAWDALVWGTGWAYPAWWDFGWSGGYWPYYPRPVTYGVGAFYNPAFGTFGRYGYAYGPYRGIAGGAAYNPRTGTYIRGGAIAGPAGSRGFVAAFNPGTGNAIAAHGGTNVYGKWGTAAVKRGGEFARISGGSTGNAAGLHWQNSSGDRGFVAGGKGGDIYAGRDGNVYRRENGEWQKHTPDGWNPVNRPGAEGLKKAGEHFASKHPEAADRIRENAPQRAQNLQNRVQNNPVAKERVKNQVQNRPSPRRHVRERAPDNLGVDRVARHVGNQRDLSRSYGRRDIGQFGGGRQFGGGGGGGREFSGFHGGGGGFHGGGGRIRRR
ncbi:SH3 domain-containing protein [Rhizobium ruizarguesonis]|uniref:SH3 domain-containing protein n=1 Tax=Rhizobium ruizarguesonis TaxID=2081791 RepID=UPI0013C1510E|nr:SH3 domain-containing protein [Rhizobium ruizarguesonis]NEI96435.1 SH3 domain-containing protein [Rhizobium ruizarguesonis]NEJ33942.1 SH3 domain-containing protein [Rhizobium ruizarguesonis]